MYCYVKISILFYTADAQDFPPKFVNPDSDSGDWIDVYENEYSGVYIYTLSVNDLDGNDTFTYRCLFVSYFSQQIHYLFFCICDRLYWVVWLYNQRPVSKRCPVVGSMVQCLLSHYGNTVFSPNINTARIIMVIRICAFVWTSWWSLLIFRSKNDCWQ